MSLAENGRLQLVEDGRLQALSMLTIKYYVL